MTEPAWMTEFSFPPDMPDDGICTAYRSADPRSRCPEPAVVTVLAGCEGEFLRLNAYCPLHLRMARDGTMRCRRCLRAAGKTHSVQVLRDDGDPCCKLGTCCCDSDGTGSCYCRHVRGMTDDGSGTNASSRPGGKT